MPKISVIIPIYNSENSIKRCLQSIEYQTLNLMKTIDFEVILVNDGSQDNSNKIIKEYIQESNMVIKYFEKENEGVAKTRNYGIERACGDYICFPDDDAEFTNKCVETALKLLSDNIKQVNIDNPFVSFLI